MPRLLVAAAAMIFATASNVEGLPSKAMVSPSCSGHLHYGLPPARQGDRRHSGGLEIEAQRRTRKR
ncbi:MAG: hypothetical protein ACREMY_08760, partial [bacterium]